MYSMDTCTVDISIHSTTRVETMSVLHELAECFISIHSTTRVETLMPISMHGYHTDFNPLHHEGGDHFRSRFSIMFLYFNPLHHEGGDLCYDDGIKMCLISIHSTTRVETLDVRR